MEPKEARLSTQEQPDIDTTGDMFHAAETAWLELIAGDDMELLESLRKNLDSGQQRLSEDGDTPLVQLLIRRVTLCEIQTLFADATYASCQDVSLPQAKFLLSRQRTMHQRLLQAIKALAMVRRLVRRSALPTKSA